MNSENVFICDSVTKGECHEEPGAKNPHAWICGGVREQSFILR